MGRVGPWPELLKGSPEWVRWPDLFGRLPDDAARESMSQSLANAHLDGWEPSRESVELLVAAAVGEISENEFVADAVVHAKRTVAARHRSS